METLFFTVQQVSGSEVEDRKRFPTVLYASDTGPFLKETWAALEEAAAEGLIIVGPPPVGPEVAS